MKKTTSLGSESIPNVKNKNFALESFFLMISCKILKRLKNLDLGTSLIFQNVDGLFIFMTVFPAVVIILISLAAMFLSIWHLYARGQPK